MNTEKFVMNDLAAKLIACLIVIICFAIGIAGLILPIIPGLLFLAIAGIFAAKISPSFERWLRKFTFFNDYLDKSEGFYQLTNSEKLKFICWLTLKIFIDTIVILVGVIGKILVFATRK